MRKSVILPARFFAWVRADQRYGPVLGFGFEVDFDFETRSDQKDSAMLRRALASTIPLKSTELRQPKLTTSYSPHNRVQCPLQQLHSQYRVLVA
jgi:hypothetical protein